MCPLCHQQAPLALCVVKNRQVLTALAAASPYAKMLATAPLAIVVCGDGVVQGMAEFLLEDCAAATQNILLAAHSLGLGAVWCGVKQGHTFYKEITAQLGLPAKVHPAAVIALGYPAQPPQTERPRFEECKVHTEKWEG